MDRPRRRALAAAAVLAVLLLLARNDGPASRFAALWLGAGLSEEEGARSRGPERTEESSPDLAAMLEPDLRDALAAPGLGGGGLNGLPDGSSSSAGWSAFARAGPAAPAKARPAAAAERERSTRAQAASAASRRADGTFSRPAPPPRAASRRGGATSAESAVSIALRAETPSNVRARASFLAAQDDAAPASGSSAVRRRTAAPVSFQGARAAAGERALRPRRFRPLLLSRLLGKNALRPPKGTIPVPDLAPLSRRLPKKGPGGEELSFAPLPPAALEKEAPPAACRKAKPHWHPGHYHDGSAWGRSAGSWAWLARSEGRWWAWTAMDMPTWLRHAGRWWWKSEGVWFVLHEGQAWGYRLFGEARQEGLIHPGSGTQMVYSADGRRVAVITPGDGAVLFDAETGAELARWSEAQMPRKAGPKVPSTLSLPSP